jgi:hypothetical protein
MASGIGDKRSSPGLLSCLYFSVLFVLTGFFFVLFPTFISSCGFGFHTRERAHRSPQIVGFAMADSALLKVDRAAKHVTELNELFGKTRPFTWVIETNTTTGERTLGPEKNESVINAGALICGDFIHNLRSALDHAYWEIVSPRCCTEDQFRKLQFPFTGKADRLDGRIQQGLAHYAGTGFYCALRILRPHGERGGNRMLYLIDQLNILDKHKLLVPTIDYTEFDEGIFRQQVPDLGIGGEDVGLSDVAMSWTSHGIPREQLGSAVPGTLDKFKRELDIPIDIIIEIGSPGSDLAMIPTLNALVDTTRQTIAFIREGAASY